MTLIDETIGVKIVGAAVATLLFGVALAQLYCLFVSEYQTTRMLKLLAAVVGLLDTAHTVFLWAWMYDVIVSNYGNIMAMNKFSVLIASCFMSFYSLGAVVQAFFTYRLWGLSGHWWLVVSLWTLEIVNYGIHTSIVVFATKSHGYMDFTEHYNGVVYAAMLSAIAISSSNTILLCWYLAKMDSGIPRTHKVVKKLILFSCETGGLQAGMALITAALWFAKPSTSFWVAFYMIDAKLYSNSLLATLNSRSRVRAALDEPISVNLPPISPSSNTGRKDRLASNCAEARLGSLCFAERGDGGVVDSELSVRKSQDFHTRCHDADFELNVEGASVSSTANRASLDRHIKPQFSEASVEPCASLPDHSTT